MREVAGADRIERFMLSLGASAKQAARVYFTGGACAVLLGWRQSTIDLDLKILPDTDDLLRELPRLKDQLQINVELVSPADFLPELPGWADRSRFIRDVGRVAYYHYDFYAQALSKIERDHEKDRADVTAMFAQGLITPEKLRDLFRAIEPALYRFPAVDPAGLSRRLDASIAAQP